MSFLTSIAKLIPIRISQIMNKNQIKKGPAVFRGNFVGAQSMTVFNYSDGFLLLLFGNM